MSSDSPRDCEEIRCLDNLPENVLLHIFSFLNYEDLCLGVRMTCLRWRRLTFDQCLWKYVEIPMHFSDRRFLTLVQVTQDSVEGLDLGKCENLTDNAISELATLNLRNLKNLTMPIASTCSDCQYIQLMGACYSLEDLSNVRSNLSDSCNPLYCQQVFPSIKICYDKPISTYGRIRKVVPAFDQRKLGQWRDDLAKLSEVHSNQIEYYECIRGTDFLNDDGLENVSKLFPNLTRMELRQCNITDEGLTKFFDNNRAEGGLTELQFDKPGDITDIGLKVIADKCPNLRNLKIARCSKITNEGVNYLLVRCPHLEEFHINNSVAIYGEQDPDKAEIDNSCLDTVGARCKSMRQFRIFHTKSIDLVGVEKLVAGCPYLVSIMLFECKNVCDKAVEAFSRLKFLKSFVLVNSDQVTPQSIISLVLRCRYLFRMTLFCNNALFYADQTQLANDVYEQIDAEGSDYMPSMMRRLTIRGVGSGFTQLLTVLCPDLVSLDIREANFITNLALRSVLRNCEVLRSLDVSALDIDEEFLLDLIRLAPELRHLTLGNSLRDCQGANEALAEVIKRCRSLSKIALNNPNKHLNERLLVHVAKQHHGGHCVLHVDPDAVEDAKHRFIDLNFTPLKYLGSITTVAFDEPFVETLPTECVEEKPKDEAAEASASGGNASEKPLEDEKAEAGSTSDLATRGSVNLQKWIELSLACEANEETQKQTMVDLQALQAALDSLNYVPPNQEPDVAEASEVQISQAGEVHLDADSAKDRPLQVAAENADVTNSAPESGEPLTDKPAEEAANTDDSDPCVGKLIYLDDTSATGSQTIIHTNQDQEEPNTQLTGLENVDNAKKDDTSEATSKEKVAEKKQQCLDTKAEQASTEILLVTGEPKAECTSVDVSKSEAATDGHPLVIGETNAEHASTKVPLDCEETKTPAGECPDPGVTKAETGPIEIPRVTGEVKAEPLTAEDLVVSGENKPDFPSADASLVAGVRDDAPALEEMAADAAENKVDHAPSEVPLAPDETKANPSLAVVPPILGDVKAEPSPGETGLSSEALASEGAQAMTQEEEKQALAKLIQMLSLTLADERSSSHDSRHFPSIDVGFLQAALESAKAVPSVNRASEAVSCDAKPDDRTQEQTTEDTELNSDKKSESTTAGLEMGQQVAVTNIQAAGEGKGGIAGGSERETESTTSNAGHSPDQVTDATANSKTESITKQLDNQGNQDLIPSNEVETAEKKGDSGAEEMKNMAVDPNLPTSLPLAQSNDNATDAEVSQTAQSGNVDVTPAAQSNDSHSDLVQPRVNGDDVAIDGTRDDRIESASAPPCRTTSGSDDNIDTAHAPITSSDVTDGGSATQINGADEVVVESEETGTSEFPPF